MTLIVIVDCRATNRTIYSRLALTIGEGVTVRAFADAAEALKWLGRNRPDLIVTDYDMPQMDGEEFISRFRGLPHSAGVPIMMITVCDQRKLRLRALESGATDFLNTPIDHCEFLTRARNLLKLSQDAGARAQGDGAQAARANASVFRAEADHDVFSEEARRLLAECGEAGDYALHVVALEGEGDPFGLAASLQRQLRGGDMLAPLDHRRFVILQKNVFGPADAEACARRLSGLRAPAPFHVRTALPQTSGGSADQRAADCLREATAPALAQRGAEASGQRKTDWRFLPRVNLETGDILGAQVLAEGAQGLRIAEVGDPESLQAALAAIASLRCVSRNPARFSLKLRLAGSSAASASALALRLAPLLSVARVSPARLELQICAREALIDPSRAEAEARALKMLGTGLILDLGALDPGDLRAGDQWADLLSAFTDAWCDAIQFPASGSRAFAVARRLRSLVVRRVGRAPPLLADGVSLSESLKPLLRAGAAQAQGPCFGAPFSARDLRALFLARDRAQEVQESESQKDSQRRLKKSLKIPVARRCAHDRTLAGTPSRARRATLARLAPWRPIGRTGDDVQSAAAGGGGAGGHRDPGAIGRQAGAGFLSCWPALAGRLSGSGSGPSGASSVASRAQPSPPRRGDCLRHGDHLLRPVAGRFGGGLPFPTLFLADPRQWHPFRSQSHGRGGRQFDARLRRGLPQFALLARRRGPFDRAGPVDRHHSHLRRPAAATRGPGARRGRACQPRQNPAAGQRQP
jgi:CheY-like chemotaxis protein